PGPHSGRVPLIVSGRARLIVSRDRPSRSRGRCGTGAVGGEFPGRRVCQGSTLSAALTCSMIAWGGASVRCHCGEAGAAGGGGEECVGPERSGAESPLRRLSR